ncbi:MULTISPECIES: ABC transporter ATP-binding protein [unclassified Polynucleobacter]|uniref:ABC transporter ATP-binding protein n=1 Tax=unclassified Polynucleobacter TaxID=2640945 RepID=UPI001C20E278|nr:MULTISPECIES: ABC transporter ATP-binding protein [unclassified Polynucleobacter]MBU3559142.1 ABC transporter ATP-binding protein [Polynucleobacter sp. Nonnen-W13]QWE29832.1 ABC transporter ATP-binding protein [Polynucleobacter sp. Adler-ghost]
MILEMLDVHVNLGLSHVLQGVNLAIKPGETVGLFGRNGVGKTTIVKTIAGWHRPSQGKILFQDQSIEALPPNEITRLGMGLVPEDRRIFPGLSVEGNLRLGLMQVQASERKAAEQRMQMVFERFPRLRERQNQSGTTLSGGEQQMLAMARVLVGNPKLLLIDEPTEGLAPMVVADIFRLMEELKSQGISILLIEQNIHKAIHLCDRHYVVERGRVVLEGNSRDQEERKELIRRVSV